MSDWVPLREYIAEQVDAIILSTPDRMVRAYLAANRERALDMLVDKAELMTLRRMFTEPDAAAEPHPPAQRVFRVNGHSHAILKS